MPHHTLHDTGATENQPSRPQIELLSLYQSTITFVSAAPSGRFFAAHPDLDFDSGTEAVQN
jgi:hypothetical protein